MNKGCPRCGSDQHNVSGCPWPVMMMFGVMGAALAACIMNIVSVRQ